MGIMVYSLLWVMQDLYHQPYVHENPGRGPWGSRKLEAVNVGEFEVKGLDLP